jgi:hypothetical protein
VVADGAAEGLISVVGMQVLSREAPREYRRYRVVCVAAMSCMFNPGYFSILLKHRNEY